MSQFPLSNLWIGIPCGKEQDCTTRYQGVEVLPNCTRQLILYENVCASCRLSPSLFDNLFNFFFELNNDSQTSLPHQNITIQF